MSETRFVPRGINRKINKVIVGLLNEMQNSGELNGPEEDVTLPEFLDRLVENGVGGGSGGTYEDSAPLEFDLGKIPAGTDIQGCTWQQVIWRATHTTVTPTLAATFSIEGLNLLEGNKVDDFDIEITVSGGNEPVQSVEVYVNNTLDGTWVNKGRSADNTIAFNYKLKTPLTETCNIKVAAVGAMSGIKAYSAEKTIKFKSTKHYSYIGTILEEKDQPDDYVRPFGLEPNPDNFTEDHVKALMTKVLLPSRAYTTSPEECTVFFGRFVYAYPKEYGELTVIKDHDAGGVSYMDSYTHREITVDDHPYWLYYLTDSCGFDTNYIIYE